MLKNPSSQKLEEWPVNKKIYVTLDLEQDHAGFVNENTFEALNKIPKLLDILESQTVPLTCFVQTQILDVAYDSFNLLKNASTPVEFHAHSHTHPNANAENSVRQEIILSLNRLKEELNKESLGYRFPFGAISKTKYEILDECDVPFSASLFPSWHPGYFNNSFAPTYPFRPYDLDVIEIPFSVFSNVIRIPISLSYIKLLGRPYEELVLRYPPNVIIFDMHMHDLFSPSAFEKLSKFHQIIYKRRRDKGFKIFRKFIDTFKNKGYEFGKIINLYKQINQSL